MIQTIRHGSLTGSLEIPCSKSVAHRLLILAALGTEETEIVCRGISRDMEASASCLQGLGAQIRQKGDSCFVTPIRSVPRSARILPCAESGSTLRFLLPLVGALNAKAAFYREGRLAQRTISPLDEQLRLHGMEIEQDGSLLICEGQLRGGDYSLPGDVSSQFISGLLMALPLLADASSLIVSGRIESAPYLRLTEHALQKAGIRFDKREQRYEIPPSQRGRLPRRVRVEGDWSNAAFFLCAGAFSRRGVRVTGLDMHSAQGDRAVLSLLRGFGAAVEELPDGACVRSAALHAQEIDAAQIPDLIPVLSVVAAAAEGESRIINASRLRLKESDRLTSTAAMLRELGAEVDELPDGLVIRGKGRLKGGTVDSWNDHRIAMSAAVAASVCDGDVTVKGAESVEKSYPAFWTDLARLEAEV